MAAQAGRVREGLVAELTHERAVPRMDALVASEVRIVGEPLAAESAHEWTNSGVNALVSPQLGRLVEALVAEVAAEAALLEMHLFMRVQAVGVKEGPVANSTGRGMAKSES